MDPAKMKVVDLRSELGALGLDTKGNKPALVDRLKKALEAKTGKVIPDTSILDTSCEDADDISTPKRAGPAARTRRSSSTRQVQTPAKNLSEEQPDSIEEERDSEDESSPPETKQFSESDKQDVQLVSDERSHTPISIKEDVDEQEQMEDEGDQNEQADQDKEEKMEKGEEDKKEDLEMQNNGLDTGNERRRELTEEEEWEELNERLQIREKERLERERKQAEEDAKKFEEVADNPVKLMRLKRKQEKKARWSNYYRSIEVTNEVLAPTIEEEPKDAKGKKDTAADAKLPEPEINDDKVTLSWYDSDVNQYLELPELNSVVPLTESVFAHAWAGVRATHGVASGRVCYEVRVGSVMTTTEASEDKAIINGLRIGWSTEDSTLHLGEGEFSWGYESTGRAVNNGEFKEYGKALTEKDVVGVYLDLQSRNCKISYTLNGVELGIAYEFDKSALNGKPLFPHVLTKNMCYKVNFGYERYNMLTKTKIVRKRIELPVEQVLEEKRKREAEIQRQKLEAARKAREKREKDRKEREERMRKKREERERIEKEKKEKEAQERKDRGEEPESMETQEEPKEKEAETEPKENGEEPAVLEVKTEPMETEQPPPPLPATKEVDKEVKTEPDEDVVEVTEEQVLGGYVLDKRIKFVIRYEIEEQLDGSEACLLPGYILISHGNLVEGPRRPLTLAECEVILMVGMPGSGKTYWAKQHAASHPEKRYNIISTGALFDKMKVDCKPFRSSYEGRWDAMVTKCAKCVLKLLEMAQGRRRNFILDQTNVYPSAQRRKLKEFEGYRRVAVVIVTDEETYKERQKQREEADGKEVPDGAIMDMKANFGLPEKSAWVDEVIYPELNEEEAKKIVEAFHKEAKAAGVNKEREKRDRSANRDGPPNKKQRPNDKKFGGRDDRRSRSFGRDRGEDRWGGGGGGGGLGGRWGPAGGGMGGAGGRAGGGGGGGRWGPPAPRGGDRGPPGGGRFDRGWGAPSGRDDFGGGGGGGGRDRDGFRGGRGGPGGLGGPGGRGDRGLGGPPGGMRGPAMGGPMRGPGMGAPMGGPMGGPGMGGPPVEQPPGRFNRGGGGDRGGNRGPPSGPPADKRQGGPAGDKPRGGGGGGITGGAGSWQRGSAEGVGRGGGGGGGNRGGAQGRGSQALATQGSRAAATPTGNQKDGQNQNQNQSQNQQGWNQWANQWGGWGNWNQNQAAAAGWGNWGNWGNWGQQPNANNASGGASGGSKNQGQQGQWPANYTAQQWYQWQQWQQQQGWPAYQQGNQQGATAQDQQQAWAQYYQNYGGANAGNAGNTAAGGDKK